MVSRCQLVYLEGMTADIVPCLSPIGTGLPVPYREREGNLFACQIKSRDSSLFMLEFCLIHLLCLSPVILSSLPITSIEKIKLGST